MKRFVCILVAAVLALAGESMASAQMSNLSFGKYKISRISPHGFRAVDGEASVFCTNKGQAFKMSNISGVVYKKGQRFVYGSASPVSVPRGGSDVVVRGQAALYNEVTLWDVLSCIVFNPADYTIDVSMTIATEDGKMRQYSKRGMSVSLLLKRL